MAQYPYCSIAELHTLLSTGKLTCEALARQVIKARKGSSSLAAFRVADDALLLSEAGQAQTLISAGQQSGLTGLPFSVKDMFSVTGYDCFAGMAHPVPTCWDARSEWGTQGTVVSAIRRSGGMVAGITHAAELAVGGVGVNAHWGSPRNPWDAVNHRVSGGSSSGAAISVISGASIYALGTDTGGSVRVPASAAGIVGLKTSSGLWPVDGVVPLASRFDTIGVLSTTVKDACSVFAGINRSLFQSDKTVDAGTRDSTADRVGLDQYRFRRASLCAWSEMDEGISVAIEGALGECIAAGMRLEDHDDGLFQRASGVRDDGPNTAAYEAFRLVESAPGLIDSLSPYVRDFIHSGSDVSRDAYETRLTNLLAWRGRVAEELDNRDIIISPTLIWTPPTLDALQCRSEYARYSDGLLHNTVLPSVSGLCAITLPVGLDAVGMPVGLQLCARSGNENTLLKAALMVEQTIGTGLQRCGLPPMLNRAL